MRAKDLYIRQMPGDYLIINLLTVDNRPISTIGKQCYFKSRFLSILAHAMFLDTTVNNCFTEQDLDAYKW